MALLQLLTLPLRLSPLDLILSACIHSRTLSVITHISWPWNTTYIWTSIWCGRCLIHVIFSSMPDWTQAWSADTCFQVPLSKLGSRTGSHFLASGQGGWAANLPLHLCFPNRSFCQWETIPVANAPETMAPRITRKCKPLHYWKIVICWGGIITCVSYVLIFYHKIKVEIRFKVSTQIMSTFSRCLEKLIYCVIILSFYAIKGKYLRSSQYLERCLLTTPVH